MGVGRADVDVDDDVDVDVDVDGAVDTAVLEAVVVDDVVAGALVSLAAVAFGLTLLLACCFSSSVITVTHIYRFLSSP